ncbi:Protein T19D12.9 [Aphelenchoides avenae]|nr:Protein T19D12.9 [Aphelenchus avenae]
MADSSSWMLGNNTRFLILYMSMFCLTLIFANSLALNFTIICMEPSVSYDSTGNKTMMPENAELYTASEKSWLFSATPVGNILGALPISLLQTKFGFKKCLVTYGSVSVIATLLLPLAANIGYWPLFAARVLQGFAIGIAFPAVSTITAGWSPIKNSGVYVSMLLCHLQLAPLLMMPLAGQMCESSLGWPAVYYVFGATTAVFILAFYVFYEDSPRAHRKVSQKELCMIEEGKEAVLTCEKPTVPYRAMFTDVVIWAILLEYFGAILGMLIFMLYGPLYLHDALGFEVKGTGFAAALPFLLGVILKLIAGPLSDRASCISQRSRIIVASIMSQGGMAVSFIILALLPVDQKLLIQVFFTIVSAVDALNCIALDKSCQLVRASWRAKAYGHIQACAKYGYVIQSIVTLCNGVIALIIPLMIGILAPNNTADQWRTVFWLVGVLVIVTDIPFLLTAQDKPRPWVSNAFSNRKIVPIDLLEAKVSVAAKVIG